MTINVVTRLERHAESWEDGKRSAMEGNPVLFPADAFLALTKGIDDLKRENFILQCALDAALRENGLTTGEMR